MSSLARITINERVSGERGQHGAQPAWVRAVALLPALAGIALPLLPVPELRTWSREQAVFLAVMLVAPPLLLLGGGVGQRARSLFLITCLALFGFLQLACPRPTGAVELLIVNALIKGQGPGQWLMHLLKLGVLLTLALLFGRYFCAYICPKGAIQELLFRPGLRLTVPPRVDRALRAGKYLAAALLVTLPLIWGFRLFRQVGPFKVIFNLDGSPLLVAFLAVVLVASVFVSRPFCRYLCPVGGILALAGRVSLLRVRLDSASCSGGSCAACIRTCPVDAIERAEAGGTPAIASAECIACNRCIAACPSGAIRFGARKEF
jgi:NAD-dependent dihydropyrimidine dehydrogenase PreA subunit